MSNSRKWVKTCSDPSFTKNRNELLLTLNKMASNLKMESGWSIKDHSEMTREKMSSCVRPASGVHTKGVLNLSKPRESKEPKVMPVLCHWEH